MAEKYIAFCEKLWRDWLNDKLAMPNTSKSRLHEVFGFDLKAAPEPYISFGAGTKPLFALTTNPGKTMRHQRRHAKVKVGDRPLSENRRYAGAARKLGEFYETDRHLIGQARSRIAKLRMLSCCLGYEGVQQVEACPFHSPSLRKKRALLREVAKKEELLGLYAKDLRGFLRERPRRPVVVIQAAPTQASLSEKTKLSCWLRWVAEIAGLELKNAKLKNAKFKNTKFVWLVKKGSKVTAAAWVSRRKGGQKALVLLMGANDLPAYEGLTRLAAALRKFWGI